jgi:hypothetical protein
MFDVTMTEEQCEQFRQQLEGAVRDHINGEDLVVAGAFRRGGAATSYAASKVGGGLVHAAISLGRKKKAGGLPQQVLLALTPDRLYAFESKMKGRDGYQVKKEVAVWERLGLRVASEQKMGMTNMTIESPAEGEKATLVPCGVNDDAVNVEFIRVIQEAHPAGPGSPG